MRFRQINTTEVELKPTCVVNSMNSDAAVQSSWRDGRAGGYGSPQNPQLLLCCPHHTEKMVVLLEREDKAKDQGLILFVYKYTGKGGYVTELVEEFKLDSSKFVSTDRGTLNAGKFGCYR